MSELHGIRDEVQKHLFQPFLIKLHDIIELRGIKQVEFEQIPFSFGLDFENLLDIFEKAHHRKFFREKGEHTTLQLRRIDDV